METDNEEHQMNPRLAIWTIYFSPLDFPNEYVARMFDLDKPTNNIFRGGGLDELRVKIQNLSGHDLVRINRSENDHRSVIESWL
jgi:hypothetical protein